MCYRCFGKIFLTQMQLSSVQFILMWTGKKDNCEFRCDTSMLSGYIGYICLSILYKNSFKNWFKNYYGSFKKWKNYKIKASCDCAVFLEHVWCWDMAASVFNHIGIPADDDRLIAIYFWRWGQEEVLQEMKFTILEYLH